MSNYGDMYRADADARVVSAYLPEWYKKLDWERLTSEQIHAIKVRIAESFRDQGDIQEITKAVGVLAKLVR